MNRRQFFLSGLPSITLGAATSQSGTQLSGTQAFVLVHGAWHGGWCWTKVTKILRKEGFDVYTPTLTGLGERSHLLRPEIDLETHVTDVVSLLEFEDLHHVHLVGHSYGGMVISGVAERAASRLKTLTFLDAFLPDDQKALVEYVPKNDVFTTEWKLKPFGDAQAFGVVDPSDAAWVNKRLVEHPAKTFTQKIKVTENSLDKGFILTSEAPWFLEAAERAKKRGFRFARLQDAGHDAMITRPGELAKTLIQFGKND